MDKKPRCLAVIPARGGSEGIPRKNVSLLNGKPLVYYAVRAATSARGVETVLVSSDDDEIANLAETYGAKVISRGAELSRSDVGVDPVIYDAVTREEGRSGIRYDVVVTLLPTSPLITAHTVDTALREFCQSGADTMVSLVDSTHLIWQESATSGLIVPAYPARVNRQQLPRRYREFGLMICRRDSMTSETRIGRRIVPFIVDELESVDVYTRLDWMLCEQILNMSRIVFVVTGSERTGTGHFHRCLTLAEGLAEHPMNFLCTPDSHLAYDFIRRKKFPVEVLDQADAAAQVLSYEPDIVINDMLNTEQDYIKALKDANIFVVNLEDEGQGAREADLVINALYEDGTGLAHWYHGEKYFCMRSEFVEAPEYVVKPQARHVLLTFGGTDPLDLTRKTLLAVDESSAERGIDICIVTGIGYAHREELKKQVCESKSKVEVVDEVAVISRYMIEADVCLTSCGRTVYELASLGVPTIAIAQHERELRHAFIDMANGICPVVGTKTTVEGIRKVFEDIADSYMLRQIMSASMKKHDLAAGTENVLRLVFEYYDRFKETRK